MKTLTNFFFLFFCFFVTITANFLTDEEYENGRLSSVQCWKPLNQSSVYDFSIENVYENETISLSNYTNQVLLLVNVATY